MKYDFDKTIDRRATNSYKWDSAPEGVLPMWVADMDFRTAPAIIDALQKAGYMHPDGYSGRVLSWLVRRTPLVSRTVANPVVYAVHLDWLVRPPPECLDHHQLRRR